MRRSGSSRARLFGWLLCVALCLPACRSLSNIEIVGTEQQNGGGFVTDVVVYQLADRERFERANLEAFWRDDRAALADDLLPNTRQAIQIRPGDVSDPLRLKFTKQTQYVGFAANLREPYHDEWRVIMPLRSVTGRDLRVVVLEDRIRVDRE